MQRDYYEMLAEFTLVATRPEYDFEKNKALVYRYMKPLENMLYEAQDISISQLLTIIEIEETDDDSSNDPRINEIGKLLSRFTEEIDRPPAKMVVIHG